MKIAIISAYDRLNGHTGDMVQAVKTAAAMRRMGHDVIRGFVKLDTGEVFSEDAVYLGEWEEVFADREIVHSIPPIPWRFLKCRPKIKAKFACSTVFWRTITYTRVLHKVQGHFDAFIIKDIVRSVLAYIGVPTYTSFYGYDLLLPNSEDEIRNFLRYCRIKQGASVIAVPNAIDELPENVDAISRSKSVPSEDYILVPGVFALRKNQLTFINAMRGTNYKIVFIGDGPLLERCKSVATSNMHFLGYVENGGQEFYSILKYARVVCLPSNCETPGIAGLEGAALGARPVVPYEGGTSQYYGWDAEYINPLSEKSIRRAIGNAWDRGRLREAEQARYRRLSWDDCARLTLKAYEDLIMFNSMHC